MMEKLVKIKISRLSTILCVISVFAGLVLGDVTDISAQASREWTDPVNISRSGESTAPVTVKSLDGVIHTIWFDVFEEVYRYSKSEDGGITWSAAAKGNFPFPTRTQPIEMVADSLGVIHIFWMDGLNLNYARATSSQMGVPSDWSSDKRIARFVVNFAVDVTPRGNLHLAYITSVKPEGVSYQYSADGVSWSPAKFLFESSYLRTASLQDAHIRVVASDDPEDKKVYVTWDVRSQKRIYLTSSPDYGLTWTESEQIKGPEDTGGIGIPFGVEIGIVGKSTLLLWQVGEPGAGRCMLYSQWLREGSSEWEAPQVVVDSQLTCPDQVSLSILESSVPIILLTYTGNSPSLLAWDGTAWSEPQPQDELSFISDPLTFETIMLGCLRDVVDGETLILVGCDLGKGGDIWITSRSLASWEDWFTPSTTWSLPEPLVSSEKEISSLVFTSDSHYVHAVWAESPITDVSLTGSAIFYARWDGMNWSTPQSVHSNLSGHPSQLSIAASNQGRLELFWINDDNGDLVYSWANSERAVNATEWADPLVIPSPSQWNSAPDAFVDSTGRIGVVYAVPVNENRGIYLVISEDKGLTWSSPSRIFDAEAVEWEMVDDPRITLSDNDTLHILFTRYATLQEKPIELYYSKSSDAGVGWTEPQSVGNGEIMWSDLASYEGNFIHRLWQEKNNSEIASLGQVSTDGGATWGNPISIASVSDSSSAVGLIFDGVGELHFVRLEEDHSLENAGRITLTIHDSRWDGKAWAQEVFQEFTLSGRDAYFSIAGGLAANGFINVCIVAQYYDLDGNLVHEILSIDRSLGQSNESLTPFPAEISNPEVQNAQTPPALSTVLPSAQLTPLSSLAEGPSPMVRNILGLTVFLVALGVMIFVFTRQAFRKK